MAKSSFSAGMLFEIAKPIWKLLTKHSRKKSIWVLLMILIAGAVDVIGLSTILPVLALAQNPESIFDHKILADLYDWTGSENSESFVLLLFFMLVPIFLFRGLIYLSMRWVVSQFACAVIRYMSVRLLRYYLFKPFRFIQATSSADLLRNVFYSTHQFSSFLLIPYLQIMSELVVTLMILISLFVYNPKVFIMLIITMLPIAAIFYLIVRKRMDFIGRRQNDINAHVIRRVKLGLEGYTDVKLSQEEDFFIKDFEGYQRQNEKLNVERNVLNEVFPRLAELTAIIGVVVIYFFGVRMSEGGTEEIVLLLGIFATAAYRLMPSINRIVASLMLIKQYRFLVELFDGVEEVDLPERIDKTPEFEGTLKLENVRFAFDEKDFSFEIDNLEIRKGEAIGVIGQSGSGKTTLINLILGFYIPEQGKMTLDQVQLQTENQPDWQSYFGYVKQDVYIAEASLLENIAFGYKREEVDEKWLMECIKLAMLEDVLDKLPNGWDSPIGEDGAAISGGQRQRVAIARALFRRSSILIFDEATSALDEETENEITESIHKLSDSGITLIIVAHRKSTLKYCNRILEMKDGKIQNVTERPAGSK
ncbi:ATP-binding cassette domain-containing protein [bacterium SCSIO 12741]|nr:ATP-binding cassette domain-containing protein [bacterium SCSIO 12741]